MTLSEERKHFKLHINTCFHCENWGTPKDGGNSGCLRLETLDPPQRPCRISTHLLKGLGCVDDPPKFEAVTDYNVEQVYRMDAKTVVDRAYCTTCKMANPLSYPADKMCRMDPTKSCQSLCDPTGTLLATRDSKQPSRYCNTLWLSWTSFRSDIADWSSALATEGIDAVAGIPRSGLVVASELSVRLGAKLFSLESNGLIKLSSGRRISEKDISFSKLLVVDDSVASGQSILTARTTLKNVPNVVYGAVYTTERGSEQLDLYYRCLELPHWFEWHLLGCQSLLNYYQAGTDFDGVLCPDFTSKEDDDGPQYLNRMTTMPCIRHSGTAKIPYIVTSRLEKYRQPTERWLARHRIRYGELIMGPWKSKREREGKCIGTWKSEVCKDRSIKLFLESDFTQTQVMRKVLNDVTVLCTSTYQVDR